MSVATVKAHVSRALEKLELNNRVQIALLAPTRVTREVEERLRVPRAKLGQLQSGQVAIEAAEDDVRAGDHHLDFRGPDLRVERRHRGSEHLLNDRPDTHPVGYRSYGCVVVRHVWAE
jgi:hypothetical protein